MRILPRALPAVSALALAAGLWLSRLPQPAAALYAVALLVAAGAVVWALADLESFTLVTVLAALSFPAALLHGAGANVAAGDLLLLVALGGWLARAAAGTAPPAFLAGNPLLAPTLLFAAVTAASFAWSTDHLQTARATVQTVEIVVVVTIVFASLPASLRQIRRGLIAYVCVTTGLAIVAALAFGHGAADGAPVPQYLPGLHKNSLGAFIGVGLVLAYTLSLDRRCPVLGRRALQLAALVQLLGLAASFSRGAIVGSLVAALAVTALLRRGRVATLLMVGAVAAVLAIVAQPVLDGRAVELGGYDSATVRTYSYADGIEQIAARPLLGTGAGTYWVDIPELQIGLTDPSNMFLLTGAELGLGGLAALLVLLHRFGLTLVRARRLPEPAALLAIATGGAALSRLVHFQFDVTWTRGTATICFALVGLMLAAIRLAPRERAHREPRADQGAPMACRPAAPPAALRGAHGGGDEQARPLRVLHVVSSSGFAGIERHVLRLCRDLSERGARCAIACPPAAKRLRAEAAAAGIPVVPGAGARRRAWLLQLVERAAAAPPDVVHVHDGAAAVAGWRLASTGRARLVRTQHFVRPASAERSGIVRDASLALHRRLNRTADALIAVSESAAATIRDRREARPGSLAVVPPGIELPDEEALQRAVAARDRLEHPTVAFVGRMEAEKAPALLVEAIPLVLAQVPACRFVIAGSGSLEAHLRRRVRTLGVEHAITWAGAVPDPGPVLEGAHVLVNPCAVEGFGLATAEAMAHAVPVVGIRAGGTAELVEHGVSGLLVAEARPAALAEAVVRLARDRRLAVRMGRAARRRAGELFSSERTAESTLSVYERVVSGASR